MALEYGSLWCVKVKMAVGIANYHEVIESLHDPEVLLIDVRDPSEIEESGSIPKSINIPCERVNNN